MKQDSLIEQGKDYIMNTYNIFPIVIERGEGNYLFDLEGKKYLDFVSGIAVNSLGYMKQRTRRKFSHSTVQNYPLFKPLLE